MPADGPIHAIMVTLDPLLSVHNIIHSHDNQSGFVMTRGVTVVTPTPLHHEKPGGHKFLGDKMSSFLDIFSLYVKGERVLDICKYVFLIVQFLTKLAIYFHKSN